MKRLTSLVATLAVCLVLTASCASTGTAPVPLDQQVLNAVHTADAVVPGILALADSLHLTGTLKDADWRNIHKAADDLAVARNAALAAVTAYEDAVAANPNDTSHDAQLAALLAGLNQIYATLLSQADAHQLAAPAAKAHKGAKISEINFDNGRIHGLTYPPS